MAALCADEKNRAGWRLHGFFVSFSRLPAFCAALENCELGAGHGYRFYRNGTVYAPWEPMTAGLRNRFGITSWLTEDMYQNLSGEFRYPVPGRWTRFFTEGLFRPTYKDSRMHSHYDLLFHLHPRERRFRPISPATRHSSSMSSAARPRLANPSLRCAARFRR